MDKLRTYILLAGFVLLSMGSKAQISEAIDHLDSLTEEWESISADLADYDRLSLYCDYSKYKKKAVAVLQEIHHYDTTLIDILYETHVDNKTMHQIEHFEHDLTIDNFIGHLKHECVDRQQVEKRRRKIGTNKDFGEESYSAERYVVETEIVRYIHRVNRKIEHLKDNVHHLDIYREEYYSTTD